MERTDQNRTESRKADISCDRIVSQTIKEMTRKYISQQNIRRNTKTDTKTKEEIIRERKAKRH